MTDKQMIKYLRKQSNMWEKNCEVIGNKYLKLYVKYNKLKKKRTINEQIKILPRSKVSYLLYAR